MGMGLNQCGAPGPAGVLRGKVPVNLRIVSLNTTREIGLAGHNQTLSDSTGGSSALALCWNMTVNLRGAVLKRGCSQCR